MALGETVDTSGFGEGDHHGAEQKLIAVEQIARLAIGQRARHRRNIGSGDIVKLSAQLVLPSVGIVELGDDVLPPYTCAT